MKIIASILLSLAWLGIAFTQYGLVSLSSDMAGFLLKAIGGVLTPLALLISAGVFGMSAIWALPKLNGIAWLMCLLGVVPLVYFYGPLVFDLLQNGAQARTLQNAG